MSDAELRRVFDFDEKDLAVNRHGRLSVKQDKNLRKLESRAGYILKGVGVVLILFAAGISYAIIQGEMLEPGVDLASALTSFNVLFGLALTWAICGLLAVYLFRLSNVNIDKTIKTAEGEVRFERVTRQVHNSGEDEPSHTYAEQIDMRVGGETFPNVSANVVAAVDEGDVYAFYYLVSMKRILSAEFIRSERNVRP